MSCHTLVDLDKLQGVQCPVCHNIYATDAKDPQAPCHAFKCGHVICVGCYDKCPEIVYTCSTLSNDGCIIPPPRYKKCPTCNVESKVELGSRVSYDFMGLVAELTKEQQYEQSFYIECHMCKVNVHIDRAWVCTTCHTEDMDTKLYMLCSFCSMKKHRDHEMTPLLHYKSKSESEDAEVEFRDVVHGFHDLIQNNYKENGNDFERAEEAVRLACERARDAESIGTTMSIIKSARERVNKFEVASDAYLPALRMYTSEIKEFIDDINGL